MPVYWAFAALDIVLRIIVFRQTTRIAFGWFLAFTIPGECLCFWLGWTHAHGSFTYDYFWRGYESVSLVSLVWMVREAVGFKRVPATPLIACLTFFTLFLLHHNPRWPSFWLEPVLLFIFTINLVCGLSLIAARRWTLHSTILCTWCLLTAALYSGAALEPKKVGLAGEILNCVAFGSWAVTSRHDRPLSF